MVKTVIEVWCEVAGAAEGDALADAAAELVDMHEGGVLRPGVLRCFADALRAEGYPAPTLSLAESTVARLALHRVAMQGKSFPAAS